MISEYSQKQGKAISDFLIGKMVNGIAKVVAPKHYTITHSSHVPEETAEGELVYFFQGATINITFKIEGTKFVRELVKHLDGVKW